MKLCVLDILPTPNPNSLRFVLNAQIANRPRTLSSPSDAIGDSLAEEILHYPGIESIFYLDNFITVTKSGADSWDNLQNLIRDSIEKTDFFTLPQMTLTTPIGKKFEV